MLELIKSAAEQICSTATARGSKSSVMADQEIRAELDGLRLKLAQAGASASYFDAGSIQDVLRSSVTASIQSDSACRLKVFQILEDGLAAHDSSAVTGPPDSGNRPGVIGSMLNTLLPGVGTSLDSINERLGRPLDHGIATPGVSVAPKVLDTVDLDTVDKVLDVLKTANVAFNTPEKARVGKTIIIEARLSTRLNSDELKALIEESGKREVGTLKVSNRMIATLSGASAFDISPSGPQEQWISDRETTTWQWQVVPKSIGEQFLILSFDVLISVNGKEGSRTINTFKRRIQVDVSWPETATEWLELIKKTGENISFIWVTLLIPIGGGLWAWIKRRRQPPEPAKSDFS